MSVPDLTRNGYYRSANTTAQIEGAMVLSAAELLDRAAISNENSLDWIGPEAIVFFIRRFNREGKLRARDALFENLARRCAPFFRGKIRGFSLQTREDIQQEVLRRLVEGILAHDDRADFAEVRFWQFLNRRVITEIERCREQESRLQLVDQLGEEFSGSGSIEPTWSSASPLGADDQIMLSEALSVLDPRLRQVFVMRYYLGMSIGKEDRASEDPNELSIAAHFKVSARSISKWLAAAELQLQKHRKG